MKITAKWLKEKDACPKGVTWFTNQKETDSIEVLKALIKEKKLDWANWTIVRLMTYKQYVKYAVFSAEQVLGNFEKIYPGDNRPRLAIEAAKACIKNPSEKNKAACLAANSAAYSAASSVARSATRSAASSAMKIKILEYGIKILRGGK